MLNKKDFFMNTETCIVYIELKPTLSEGTFVSEIMVFELKFLQV